MDDSVSEINFLAEKGHQLLTNGNYSAAKTFFIDAASLALESGSNLPEPTQSEFQHIAKQLIRMAKSAHRMTFQNIENKVAGVEHAADRMEYMREQEELAKLSEGPDPFEQQQLRPEKFEFPLGRSVDTKDLMIWRPEELMNGITLVTGGSGSGKSETLRGMAAELSSNNIPVVVLDLHGDLDLDFDTISLDYRGHHSVNPMELTSYSEIDGGPTPHINRLMLQFDYAIRNKLSSTMKSWLRNLLKFAYEQHGIVQSHPERWHNDPPTFDYLLDLIRYPEDRIIASKKPKYMRLLESITSSTMMAVENRLTPILEHPAFSGHNSIHIEEIANKPVRILLKPLNTVDMQFMAADTIIRQLYAHTLAKGHITDADPSKFRLFIMIDEVKILTGFRGKKDDPYAILNRLATEARKFGLGLILASQIIGHFGRDIKSNAATKLILRTMDLDETKRCAKEFKLKVKDLSSLSRPGEGYIVTSTHPDARHIQLFSAKHHPFEVTELPQL